MSMYRIVTDATADLPQELVESTGLSVIPMECRLDKQTYVYEPTCSNLRPEVFYAQMREGAATSTSQINVFQYLSHFEPILQAGQDILYLAFSSALTGSQQSALIAIQELLEKYPGRRIVMVDTLAASLGEGLLVYAAAKKRDEGFDLDMLSQWVTDHRLKLCHWFTVDDLDYLARGGRLSAAAAFLGTALRIKPVLHVDDMGRLVPLTKVQGRKHSLKSLVENMEQNYLPEENDIVFIGHADCEADAEYVKQLVTERLNVKNFLIYFIGPIIGAHAGPGTVALFHFGKQR